jgi:hypothetical protein
MNFDNIKHYGKQIAFWLGIANAIIAWPGVSETVSRSAVYLGQAAPGHKNEIDLELGVKHFKVKIKLDIADQLQVNYSQVSTTLIV